MRASVSVIIPTHGRPAYLSEAISSVLAQTVPVAEVVVVDDGSPHPVSVPTHPLVRVVRLARNCGAAAARNEGVRHASGEVIAFLDDDDAWASSRMEGVAEALERAEIAVCWQSESGRRLTGHVHDQILDSTTPHLGATAIRRAAWIELDPTYRSCEDVEWWLRVSANSRVETIPRQGLIVRSHSAERVGYGGAQRIADSRRLLTQYSSYFMAHPKAHSHRWFRIGLMSTNLGDRREAQRAFRRAFRIRPSAAGLLHLVRSYLPRVHRHDARPTQ